MKVPHVPLLDQDKNMKNWDKFFIGMCIYISQKSKDRSTKLGAVVVNGENDILSMGWNGFPRGVDDDIEEWHGRPEKYYVTEHAERNAVFNAARLGISLKRATMYLPFEPTPCTDCTRAVIQAGITTIVGTNFKFTGKGTQWDENLAFANQMLKEAGVRQIVHDVDGDLDIRNFYGVS
jgi:dCMP deaminase